MKRRDFLKAAPTTPPIASRVFASTNPSSEVYMETVASQFFQALPATKEERNDAVVNCATTICFDTNLVSKEQREAIINVGDGVEDLLIRVRNAVRILNEYEITDVIDASTVEEGRRKAGSLTRYLPLLDSFNRLYEAACAVDPPEADPDAVIEFLYATTAFGIEVALWSIGAPYKVAWVGTRYIANRSFLRLVRYGCNSCIALAMSELHWAIRGSVYGHGVTEDRVEFVWERILELRVYATHENYDVDLDFSYEEIRRLVEDEANGGGIGVIPQQPKRFIERILSETPDVSFPPFESPSLKELLD